MNAFCCWSGGKDSTLALYRAMKKGINVLYLVNMSDEGGNYSRSHGLPSKLLKIQAHSIGIQLIQKSTSWEEYEKNFKEIVLEIKEKKNIKAGIFGDIDLQEHRDWIEKVCKELKIEPIMPLWKENREKLISEFIIDFKSIVVSVNLDYLKEDYLGRNVDRSFFDELKNLNIDISGENGEYHTFVYDGPIFKEPVKFKIEGKILKGKNCFLKFH